MKQQTIVAVIGPTGVGKSSFCNLISGVRENDSKAYPVCPGVDSGTYQTTAKSVRWMGREDEFSLIDTPGLGDSEGRDTQHIDEMTNKLRSLQYVNAFIIMFNAANPRLDENLTSQLKIFVKMFGPEFLKNALMVFNRWGYDKKAEQKREATGDTKKGFTENFNKKFRSLFGITHHIDAFFIDTYPDRGDKDEMEAINSELSKMKEKVTYMSRFPCQDITAVRGVLDELQNTIKEEQEQSDKLQDEIKDERKQSEKLQNEAKKGKEDINQLQKEIGSLRIQRWVGVAFALVSPAVQAVGYAARAAPWASKAVDVASSIPKA